MVMEYENDPRDDSSDSDSEVSGQHSSQLDSETALDDDDDEHGALDKKEASLIDLVAENLETSVLKKNDNSLATKESASVSLSTATTPSWSTASGMMSSLKFPAYSSVFSSASSNPLLFPNPNLLLQQQVEEMKRQQLQQLEKEKERDDQFASMKKQLDEAERVTREIRSENSVRKKETRNVSFSASSGAELADQAAKLAARAQRKARKKVDSIGINMNEIRSTAGIDNRVNDFMQTVNNIPSLSLGSKPAVTTNSKSNKGNQKKSIPTSDSSAPQTPYFSDGAASAVSTDNSAIAAILAQQQSMMANQM